MPVFHRKYLLIAAFLISQGLVSIVGGMLFISSPRENVIFPGVFISGVEVGGLDKEKAVKLLEQKVAGRFKDGGIILRYGDRQWMLSYRNLGVSYNIPGTVNRALSLGRYGSSFTGSLMMFQMRYRKPDLPLEYTINESVLKKQVAGVASEIDILAQNAFITGDAGHLKFVPETIGKSFYTEGNIGRIKSALGKMQVSPVMLEVSENQPGIKLSDLKGIKESIGLGITPYRVSDKGRTANIISAVKSLDGTVIEPKAQFSFNRVIGTSVRETGYSTGPLMIDGRLSVTSSGGVSQVASTLYQALLYAGIKVEERHAHTAPPGYVASGQDAAVAYGKLDLKFKNTTGYPIYVKASVKNNRVVIELLGVKKRGQTIQIITRETILSKPGRPPGVHASVYRQFYVDGTAAKREVVSEDDYPEELTQ